MFKKIVPITKEKHKDLKVKATSGFAFAQGSHLASIMVHEFSRASSIYPIVFLEDKTEDKFMPVVMLGLEEGKNLFVDGDTWRASYIPAIVRRYPFALATTGEANKYTICIDEDSDFLSTEDGEPLFNEKGEASEAIERVKKYLTELQQMERFTAEFCKYFEEKNMFTPLNMKVKVGNEIKNISGAYVINEERLNSLSDETFLEMRKKQYLSVVYAHLSSLSQIERLLGFLDKDIVTTKQIEDRFEESKK
jgi:hypothetical protein